MQTKKWLAFIDHLEKHPGMFMIHGSYPEVVAAFVGFDAADDQGVLKEFQEWMSSRAKAYKNYAFFSLVASEALSIDGQPPSIKSLTKDQQEMAAKKLFELLKRFLSLVSVKS